jgi:hypothetical protein
MSDAPARPAVILPAISQNSDTALSPTPFTDALGELREGVEVVASRDEVQVVAAKELGRGWTVAAAVQKRAGHALNAMVGARWRPKSK